MADKVVVYDISGKLQAQVTSSLVQSLYASGNINVRRMPTRVAYRDIVNGQMVVQRPVVSSGTMVFAPPTLASSSVDSAGVLGPYISCVVDPINSGTHIAYYDSTNLALKYAYAPVSGPTRIQIVRTGSATAWFGKSCEIILDYLNAPRIAYRASSSLKGEYIEIARSGTTAWRFETVPGASGSGAPIDQLGFDNIKSWDLMGVGWYSSDGLLNFAYSGTFGAFTSTSPWTREVINSTDIWPPVLFAACRLVFDSKGVVHIIQSGLKGLSTSGNPNIGYYARVTGTWVGPFTWDYPNTGPNARGISLAIDPFTDSPVVAYVQPTSSLVVFGNSSFADFGQLAVLRLTGSWAVTDKFSAEFINAQPGLFAKKTDNVFYNRGIVTESVYSGSATSLCFDQNGVAHLAYADCGGVHGAPVSLKVVTSSSIGGWSSPKVVDQGSATHDVGRALSAGATFVTNSWVQLGYENQWLSVPTNTRVRYGTYDGGGAWVEKVVSGDFPATNEYFGSDPAPGIAKVVEYANGGSLLRVAYWESGSSDIWHASGSGGTYSEKSSAVSNYRAPEARLAPSWTQVGVGKKHAFVITPLSSAFHERDNANTFVSGVAALENTPVRASGTAYYAKTNRFVRKIYKLDSSNAQSPGNASASLPCKYESVSRSVYTAASGTYVLATPWDPAVFTIDVPDYGRIRDVRVWVEFLHDLRGGPGTIAATGSNPWWRGGTGDAENYRQTGLQSVMVSLRSPNVLFKNARPLWNDPRTESYAYDPRFGDPYRRTPEILKNSYLLWAGHNVESKTGSLLTEANVDNLAPDFIGSQTLISTGSSTGVDPFYPYAFADKNGNPRLVWRDQVYGVCTAYDLGSGFSKNLKVIGDVPGNGAQTACLAAAFDQSSGYLAFAYNYTDNVATGLTGSMRWALSGANGVWMSGVLDTFTAGQSHNAGDSHMGAAADFDSRGNFHVLYARGSSYPAVRQYEIRHISVPSTKLIPTFASGTSPYVSELVARIGINDSSTVFGTPYQTLGLKVNSSGTVHAFWEGFQNGISSRKILHAYSGTNGWSDTIEVDRGSPGTGQISDGANFTAGQFGSLNTTSRGIALYKDGNPWIVYAVRSFRPGVNFTTGVPGITNAYDIRLAKFDGTSWRIEETGLWTRWIVSPALTFDAQWNPIIGYQGTYISSDTSDVTNDVLSVARRWCTFKLAVSSSIGWNTFAVDGRSGAGKSVHLFTDNFGVIHTAHGDNSFDNANAPGSTAGGFMGLTYSKISSLPSSSAYSEFDNDLDMRTIFTDSSKTPNPKNLKSLYPSATDSVLGAPRSTYELLRGGQYRSPTSGALALQFSKWARWDDVGFTHTLSGANMPWMLDERVPPGYLHGDPVYPVIVSSSFGKSPPRGWLTGPGGTAASGEFPTTGSNIGPVDIQPVYPLLDDVYERKVYDQPILNTGSLAPSVVPQSRADLIGYRPGLRGTEVHGKWQLMIGVGCVATGSVPKPHPRNGVWFRQFRLEFVLDQGAPETHTFVSRQQRYKTPSLVATRPGKRLIGIISGSVPWELGLNYVYTEQRQEYGRAIGITDQTGSSPDSFAVFTQMTGNLALRADSSMHAAFLQNEFGTPYIPISSGSGEAPSFAPITVDDVAESRETFDEVLRPATNISQANTIQSFISRLSVTKTQRDLILEKIKKRST